MGIRNLNRYLRDNCPDSIRCINMADISGKRIAVDISIYLYKYEAENALLENMYLMLSIFRHYNIIPIFIFDGKPPPEKKALLVKRKEDRETAQEEYEKLKNQLETNECELEKQHIISSMEQLKKHFVQINAEKIDNIKTLIRAYGATYYDAPGEADELCALLVIKKKVWACLSEDMDLFVYGCTRVLRYFSLMGHTAVLYYMKGMLQELDITQQEFKEICILSGTDYNTNADGKNVLLHETFKQFKKFKNSNIGNITFYDWILENTNYISDIELLKHIVLMFSLEIKYDAIKAFNDIKILNGQINQFIIEKIMREDDFIFCKQT